MQETWVQSLEKEMATHSSILAGEIPWTEEPGGLQSTGSQESGKAGQLTLFVCHLSIYHLFIYLSNRTIIKQFADIMTLNLKMLH